MSMSIEHYRAVIEDALKRKTAVKFHEDDLITIDTSVLSEGEKDDLLQVIASLFYSLKVDPLTGEVVTV